jgi:hypothetical protein
VKVYTGQTRSRRAIELCNELGLGECCNRGELPPRRTRAGWFLDCGAYADFKAGREFNVVRWERDLRWGAYRLEAKQIQAPDFVVVPDLVGSGLRSLEQSLSFVDWIPPELPMRYLVVQEGMSVRQVAAVLYRFWGSSPAVHRWIGSARRLHPGSGSRMSMACPATSAELERWRAWRRPTSGDDGLTGALPAAPEFRARRGRVRTPGCARQARARGAEIRRRGGGSALRGLGLDAQPR